MPFKSTIFFVICLFTAIFAVTPVAARVKYVAVVETEIDMNPADAARLERSEVRLITDELRGAAVKTLPQDKYSIMTAETVMSQSGSVLNECAEENCLITLGSKIGADYVVRGKLGKIGTQFTLFVSMFDTEDGFLVGTSNTIRSEKLVDLLEKTATACAEMYRKFIRPAVNPAPAVVPVPAYAPSIESKGSTTSGGYRANTVVHPLVGGYVARNPDKSSYSHGEQFVATAIPYAGYRFAYWQAIPGGRSNPVTITMDWHKNVIAVFEPLDATEDVDSYQSTPAHSERPKK
jgi:hypothetical protein